MACSSVRTKEGPGVCAAMLKCHSTSSPGCQVLLESVIADEVDAPAETQGTSIAIRGRVVVQD